ncbi:MAG: tetratricopeptide repeat protein [Rhodospirillales bacterium]|nr:tetratricopeptide repeat protein [Rhodospirillales bacterium]
MAKATTGTRRAASAGSIGALLLEAVRDHRQGRLDRAVRRYTDVLRRDPRNAEALHLLGVVHHQRGDHNRALTLIGRAIALNGDDPAFHSNLGAVLLALGRLDAAAASLRHAVTLDSTHSDALNNLGNVLMRQGQAEAAEASYRQALAARPENVAARNNLGSALREQGKLDEAAAAYRWSLSVQPRHAPALSNLGRILHDMGRYDEALECYDRAIAINPELAEAHGNRATLLLQLGRFAEGWEEYEWRWRNAGFTTPARAFEQPPWNGSDLCGRTILLHAEQGLGSAIQFVRYAAVVTGRGGRVVLECQKPLARLFASLRSQTNAAVAHLVIKGEPLPAFDVHAPLMSLPRLLGTRLETIPAAIPYLFAEEALAAEWGARLARCDGTRIGLAWAGNRRHHNDRNRSMPATALAPLAAMEGCATFSLQVGDAAADPNALPAGSVIDLAPDLRDFADTAAVISQLDLVISVDTAVAHLAGALGRPVWMLVPHVSEWRWLTEREDTPWYPTMRLFRQRSPGDWDEVVRRVRDRLATMFAPDRPR